MSNIDTRRKYRDTKIPSFIYASIFYLFFKPKLVISAQRTEIVKMVYSQTHFIYLVRY